MTLEELARKNKKKDTECKKYLSSGRKLPVERGGSNTGKLNFSSI